MNRTSLRPPRCRPLLPTTVTRSMRRKRSWRKQAGLQRRVICINFLVLEMRWLFLKILLKQQIILLYYGVAEIWQKLNIINVSWKPGPEVIVSRPWLHVCVIVSNGLNSLLHREWRSPSKQWQKLSFYQRSCLCTRVTILTLCLRYAFFTILTPHSH